MFVLFYLCLPKTILGTVKKVKKFYTRNPHHQYDIVYLTRVICRLEVGHALYFTEVNFSEFSEVVVPVKIAKNGDDKIMQQCAQYYITHRLLLHSSLNTTAVTQLQYPTFIVYYYMTLCGACTYNTCINHSRNI